jgi:hypothetical protein
VQEGREEGEGVSGFLDAAKRTLSEHLERANREDPRPAVFCWRCRAVRDAEHAFMRLMCAVCGASNGYGARWEDET